MSDFLSDGYNLNDYASEGQLFYKPTDKIRFEGALEALCDSQRHVVIVTDDKALAERYYRYFITRIAIRDNIILDTRALTGAYDVLNRFNKILSASSVESARSADNNDVHHVMAMVDTSNMSDHEWTVLGRLLKNFPGANIRMLAFVSESQLDVIDGVLDKPDGQMYRWILTSPTPEYLAALLEMGEQYNYQSETQQMAAAVGYHRRPQPPESELVDELGALDAHLDSLQKSQPSPHPKNETQAAAETSTNDFDADLNALLGAIKQSHGIDESQQATSEDTIPERMSEPAQTPQDSKANAPSRRLIWATGIIGVALVLVALVAPWEQAEVVNTQVQLTPRIFNSNSKTTATPEPQNVAAQSIDNATQDSDTKQALDTPEVLDTATQVAELDSDETDQISTEEPEPAATNAQWNDDMARILASETGRVSKAQESKSEDTQAPASIDINATSKADAVAKTEPDLGLVEQSGDTWVTAITDENTLSAPQIEVSNSAEQTDPTVASTESDTPQSQSMGSRTNEPDNPPNGALIIEQAPSSALFIQLGVYANPTQALLFMDTLPPEADAFQVRLNKSGRQLSTVLSGPFDSKALAEATATSVFGNLNVWIRAARSVKAELED